MEFDVFYYTRGYIWIISELGKDQITFLSSSLLLLLLSRYIKICIKLEEGGLSLPITSIWGGGKQSQMLLLVKSNKPGK